MKKITIINALILSLITSNTLALGVVAEAQIQQRLASKTIHYTKTNTFKGYINKRTKLSEALPFNLKDKKTENMKRTLRLPVKYDAVTKKRSKLSENYPS